MAKRRLNLLVIAVLGSIACMWVGIISARKLGEAENWVLFGILLTVSLLIGMFVFFCLCLLYAQKYFDELRKLIDDKNDGKPKDEQKQ